MHVYKIMPYSTRVQQGEIGGAVRPQILEDWAIADLKASGLGDEMISLNFQFLQGEAAVEPLIEFAQTKRCNSVRYVDSTAKRLLEMYKNAQLWGGWAAYGTTIEGEAAKVVCFKPKVPRRIGGDFKGFGSDQKIKRIKYETPTGAEALPLLPFVSESVALKIYEKCGSRPLEGESFWGWVVRDNLPIVITEGFKKAALLVQQGYPAIALRGVCNWHTKGTKDLFPILKEVATRNREVKILFDQDTKPKTIANVNAQIKKLGAILEDCGCKVSVATWDSAIGKGVDDAFVKQGAKWLDQTMSISFSFEDWKKSGLILAYIERIQRFKTLALTPDRETKGDFYLPELPSETPIGSITLIQGNMGSGKSFSGLNPVIQQWIAMGGNVLRLDPLLSLGAQGAELSNLVHSSEYDLTSKEGYSLFCSDIATRHGVAVCFNSLPRIPQWFLADRPLLLVLDEVNQGLDYLLQGNTLGSKHGEILDKFSEICFLCGHSGAIVSAEAEIHPRSVELLRKYSFSKNVRYFKHYRTNTPWQVTIGSGRLSGFIGSILTGSKKLIMTDSQASGRRIERRLRQEFPNAKIVRIDSETNRGGAFTTFFESPDKWLDQEQPDFLICSPSVKTGVSITWEGFESVHGYFVSTDPDSWAQMLGRYRPSVPRFVCCPKFVVTQGDEALYSPKAIQEHADQERNLISSRIYAIDALTEEDDRKSEIRLAASEYYAEMSALRGSQKAIARDYLVSVLTEAGHTIDVLEWSKDPVEQGILTEIQEQINREDAAKIALSPICPSVETAYELLGKECSLEDETMARKTLHRYEFPGIDFDNEEDCYWILTRNRVGIGQIGSLGRGVQVQAGIENLNSIKELDREQTEKILSDELGLSHRLPRRFIRYTLLRDSGILDLAQREVKFSNSDPRCIAIQQYAVKHSKLFRYYFGLTIEKEYVDANGKTRHTPVDVCNKLLKKLGLKAISVETRGGRGSQERIYTVEIDRVTAPPLPPQATAKDKAEAKKALQDEAWVFRDKALAAARERLKVVLPPSADETLTNSAQAETQSTESASPESSEIPSLDEYEFHDTGENEEDEAHDD
jgi:5S rRNA maturation endonuclease (ribonuclease M5)